MSTNQENQTTNQSNRLPVIEEGAVYLEPSTLYGFFHTTCIYESSAALVSLHRTKRGAVKAMIKHQHDAWMEAQRESRHWSRKEIRQFRQGDPEAWKDWSRKDGFWRKAYVHCASLVAPVEVHP